MASDVSTMCAGFWKRRTELLVQMGPVNDVRLPKGADGQPRGIAFCDYTDFRYRVYGVLSLQSTVYALHSSGGELR